MGNAGSSSGGSGSSPDPNHPIFSSISPAPPPSASAIEAAARQDEESGVHRGTMGAAVREHGVPGIAAWAVQGRGKDKAAGSSGSGGGRSKSSKNNNGEAQERREGKDSTENKKKKKRRRDEGSAAAARGGPARRAKDGRLDKLSGSHRVERYVGQELVDGESLTDQVLRKAGLPQRRPKGMVEEEMELERRREELRKKRAARADDRLKNLTPFQIKAMDLLTKGQITSFVAASLAAAKATLRGENVLEVSTRAGARAFFLTFPFLGGAEFSQNIRGDKKLGETNYAIGGASAGVFYGVVYGIRSGLKAATGLSLLGYGGFCSYIWLRDYIIEVEEDERKNGRAGFLFYGVPKRQPKQREHPILADKPLKHPPWTPPRKGGEAAGVGEGEGGAGGDGGVRAKDESKAAAAAVVVAAGQDGGAGQGRRGPS